MQKKTLYQTHKEKWSNCTKCELHEGRSSVVLFRGSIPCTILFIGEAPGFSEDVIGKPFIGPAGKMLDIMIQKTIPESMKYGLTNMLGCIPLDPDSSDKVQEPEAAHIKVCGERVSEIVKICKPKGIVCVGKVPERYLKTNIEKNRVRIDKSIAVVGITHPAAILRAQTISQPLMIKKNEVVLMDFVKDISENNLDHYKNEPAF